MSMQMGTICAYSKLIERVIEGLVIGPTHNHPPIRSRRELIPNTNTNNATVQKHVVFIIF